MQLPKQLTILFFFAMLLVSGCITRKTKLPTEQRLLPAQTQTRTKLMQDLEDQSKAISTLTARVALDVSSGSNKTGVLTEYRQTSGLILVDRPKQVRLRVLAPVIATTVVDMVSDGRQYRVSIPIKNKFMIGDANAPPTSSNALLNLRPQHILDALFVDIQPHIANARITSFLEEVTNGRIRYYVLNFIDISEKDAKLLEKIWVDRTSLQITRKQIFSGDGRMETDVEYSAYQTMAGIPFPQVISIQRPIEDYSLKITFQPASLKLNEKLADNAFLLERPAGSELVQAENTGPRPF